MSSKDAHLYGAPRHKKSKAGNELSSAGTLAFTSQLSSLIASSSTPSSTSKTTAGRSRPRKEDIFTSHNRNLAKRKARDLEDSDNPAFAQKHKTSDDSLDPAVWHRAKRKMEEKARLYAAMKRGDVEDEDERYAVDFDRKWAEEQDKEERDTSSGEDDGASEGEQDVVEYTDEFGRTRKGTRADAAREERRKKVAQETDRFTARPAAPSTIIYGDTVQAAAFNPDEPVAAQMAELAAKRDRSITPPPDAHFDGKAEIRTKGVGFFHFSADEEARKKEMENLERDRNETERIRAERDQVKESRKRQVEERRKAILEKRNKAQADKFLSGLGDLLGTGDEDDTKDSK